MKHSYVDRYADLDSPLHLLEARSKLIGFTALIIAVLLIRPGDAAAFFASFFLIAVLMGVSQIPLSYMLGRTLLLLPFVLLAGIAVPWKGAEGFSWFSALLMRSLLCLILVILLTNTTRFAELLSGLRSLGLPRILALNLGFLYRYLFVLMDEAMRMRMARDCRTVGRLPLLRELRLTGTMLGALLLRSFERAERTYQAMLSRGHSLAFPVLAPRRFGFRDAVFITVVTGFIILLWRMKS